MRTMVLKLLREKYGVTGRELGARCGFSTQRLFEIESGKRPVQPDMRRRICAALEETIRCRQQRNDELLSAFRAHQEELFDMVEEWTYEL